MASLYRETLYGKNGKLSTKISTVSFVGADGKRKAIRLGAIDHGLAKFYLSKIESLNLRSYAKQNEMSKDLAVWLEEIGAPLYKKLAKAGLCQPRPEQAPPPPKVVIRKPTIAGFIEKHISSLQRVKESTRRNLRMVQADLEAYFLDRTLESVTEGDADDFREYLSGTDRKRKLSENTVRRRMGRAKQLFRAAARRKLIQANPFEDQEDCHVGPSTDDRVFYVTAETARRVIENCPSLRWRAIFALARFGGLRTTSEHLQLRVSDIDWESKTFTIHSPKTERHAGKSQRVAPIFSSLWPYLEELYDDAVAEGREKLIPERYANPNSNWRTTMLKIIRRAGIEPWPKLFQNLRSSCSTDLANEFGEHHAARWLGHDVQTARRHYHQVPEAIIEKAAGGRSRPAPATVAPAGAEAAGNGEKAVETPLQYTVELGAKPAKSRRKRQNEMTPTGLEPVLPP